MIHHPGEFGTAAAGAGLIVAGAAGDTAGGLLDLTVVGGVVGVPVNVASTGAIVFGGGLVVAGGGQLMMHAASDDSVSPARTDYTGSDGDDYEPTEGFRGSQYSRDEIAEFINGHTGDGDPTMVRPSPSEIENALSSEPEKLDGQNAELFRSGNVKVIVNYDMPWRSTSYYVGGK
jgi:hypothetical protein